MITRDCSNTVFVFFVHSSFISQIERYDHHKIETYGKGKDIGNQLHWISIIRQIQYKGYLEKNDDYKLVITKLGREVYNNDEEILLFSQSKIDLKNFVLTL